MSEIKKPISPGKKYVLRVLDLAKKDQSIGNLMPDPSVWDTAAQEGLSQDKVIDAFLDGYAERPALGERRYVVHTDETSGKVVRRWIYSILIKKNRDHYALIYIFITN